MTTDGGYRLYRYEVLNWGTFDKMIWGLNLEGGSALLTGKNGSGKSTLVDGLITLLVEKSGRRTYNQAAGDRRERSERSYVEGAYAQSLDTDESGRQRTLKLRSGDTCSVLLAVFYNAANDRAITLAQVLYIVGGELNKLYVVAQVPLTIADDFPISGRISQLRKTLRDRPHVSVIDTARDYGAAIRRAFSLRTEQAMNLFNEIVAMKEIGDLNEFVRGHMLEPDDVRSAIDSLRGNYHELNASYELILRAHRQQTMLQPLVKDATNYKQHMTRLRQFKTLLDILPSFFDDLTMRLIEQEEAEQQRIYRHSEQEKSLLDSQLATAREHEKEVYAALQNNEVMQRITALEREIAFDNERLSTLRREEDSYRRHVRTLGMHFDGTLAAFTANREFAAAEGAQIDAQIDAIHQQQVTLEGERRAIELEISARRDEIALLLERNSQMPKEELQIRQQLCHTLGFDERDIPYIGELLQVDDGEETWRLAIEKLLNRFAREMIVPEALYPQVRQYVNDTNLRGLLIYHRVRDTSPYVSDQGMRDDSVYRKLRIHPKTVHRQWLRDKLLRQADYVCCDRDAQLDHEERAITRSGQIKRGNNRYEKDDRLSKSGRANYVLGWNNQDKIAGLQDEVMGLTDRLNASRARLSRLRDDEVNARDRLASVQRLLEITEFQRIDTTSVQRSIDQKRASLELLRSQSDSVRHLQEQMDAITREIYATEQALITVRETMTRCDNRLTELGYQFEGCQRRLTGIDLTASAEMFTQIERHLPEKLALNHLIDEQRALEKRYRGTCNSLEGTITRTREAIEKVMLNYRMDFPDETHDVDVSIDALDWYLDRLHRIETDDLQQHTKRFKMLLNDKVRQSITTFRTRLTQRETDIRKSIEQLNGALQRIAYTTSTYLRLTVKPSANREVADFRRMLSETFPNASAEDQDAENERIFGVIKRLLDRFETDMRWTHWVTDARNWLDFSAQELLISDNSLREHYQSSSGKSGGQKAKLAYTILASAIAYQYQLTDESAQDDTFRFIVIDEVFSKSDEANSRFAMDLFGQLGLQVLVVTPADKMQIVEPYIGSCHLVINNDQGTFSKVRTLTIEQIYTLREGGSVT